MMMMKDFYKAVEEGKMFWMRKYIRFGCWSAPKLVSADVAMAKSKVVVYSEDGEGYCPYDFAVAE